MGFSIQTTTLSQPHNAIPLVFSSPTLNTHCPLEQSTISRPVCWPHSLDTPPLVGQWLSHPQLHLHRCLHTSSPRNINFKSRSLTRIFYFSITRAFIPTLTTINKQPFRMSSFSNTDTGNKAADPYTAKNLQEPSLKEKVEDLQAFVDKSKFCMMTTKTQDDILASRCMAVAARVSLPNTLLQNSSNIH